MTGIKKRIKMPGFWIFKENFCHAQNEVKRPFLDHPFQGSIVISFTLFMFLLTHRLFVSLFINIQK